MKKEVKRTLIANGMFIATSITTICCLIGFIGGLLCYESKVFLIMAGGGLVLCPIIGAATIRYLPRVGGLKAVNKAIKIIGTTLIALASMVLFCTFVSEFTLAICDKFY